MGMSVGASRDQINVTPLIDVLLVLLIIFLVMMPILARVEPVALPPEAPPDTQPAEPPIVVKLGGDLSIAIDDGPPQLSSELSAIRPRLTPGKHVFVEAEGSVPWNEVVQVVDRVRGLAANADALEIAVRIHQPAEP